MVLTCTRCGSENEEGTACFTCGALLAGATQIVQGTVLADRYEIRARLGRGGMGAVYRAWDRVLGEEVAVKVLRHDPAGGPRAARRFRSEIRLARRVVHRNVGRIFDYGEDRGLSFISMELVDGVDLRRILRDRGALDRVSARRVALQVTRGLVAIHQEGILHRDLKTANLMLDRQGVVRVMDFGIAKEVGAEASTDATGTGQVVGTPDYMSPEQARGARDLDLRSDLYSLGVVIFELFTGVVPFEAENPLAVLLKHIHDAPPLDTGPGQRLPEALRPVLARALAKRPEDRYDDARQMLEALREAADRMELEPAPPAHDQDTLDVSPDDTLDLQDVGVGTPSTTPVPTEEPGETEWMGDQPTVLDSPARPVRGPVLAAAVVVAAVVGWLALGRTPTPAPPSPSAVRRVLVKIDALPWARLDLRPLHQGAAVGPLTTPVAVELAEGTWKVALENGGLTPPLETTLEVRAAGPHEFSFSMPGYDAAAVVAALAP